MLGFARAEKLGNIIAVLAILALALLLLLSASPARASDPVPLRLFGTSENLNTDISPFPKWTGMLQRYGAERALEDEPCTGDCPLQEWKAFVLGLGGLDRMTQLEAVNAYINRTPYQSDASRYGVADHWATPREFIGRTGDCEDYAIAKMLSLRLLGWSAQEMRIAVVMDENRNELHAVLIAYYNGTAYVLDNLSLLVREHTAVRHYRPIFSISEMAWHYHRDWNPSVVATLTPPKRAKPVARLSVAAPVAVAPPHAHSAQLILATREASRAPTQSLPPRSSSSAASGPLPESIAALFALPAR
jgi:predicted transglutaminase-like cysteine proteinase